MSDIHIEQTQNGYIYVSPHGGKELFLTTEALFARLLLQFEGRCASFHGESFGAVSITRVSTGKSQPTEISK